MDSVYNVLETIRDFLRQGNFTNSVTFGDLSDIDLNKLNVYPLTHMKLEDAVINEQTIDFTIRIWACDVVDKVPETFDTTADDRFNGGDDLLDVLNTQFQVINRLFQHLTRADLRDDGFHTTSSLRAEPFKDRFEMELAGWTADIVVTMRNAHPIC